jgi:hypothetical protein
MYVALPDAQPHRGRTDKWRVESDRQVPGYNIRKMVSDYFAKIINSKDSVLLVINFDYSDYFQIIF